MSNTPRRKPKQATVPKSSEPTITYSRTITLTASAGAQIKLGHVAELLRQARERGYGDDARVSLFDRYHGVSLPASRSEEIRIGDDR